MELRESLVTAALSWESLYGVAPAITSAISEYDAAMLVGCSEEDYQACMQGRTAVSKGHDFEFNGKRYQVKANRPSGKPGSFVTLVNKAKNYNWDYLIWVHYTKDYTVQEAWLWDVANYQKIFDAIPQLRPEHMRQGTPLIQVAPSVESKKKPIQNQYLELTTTGRGQVLQNFLADPTSTQYIYYSKERFYLDRQTIEENTGRWSYLIIRIQPTEASARQGYKQGHVVVTRTELNHLFGHYFKTQSWITGKCYHLPKPSKMVQSVFIEESALVG